MPDRTLYDIKEAHTLRQSGEWDYDDGVSANEDIGIMLGWVEQWTHANEMDAEARIRSAARIEELTRDLEAEKSFTEHLWHRVFRQMDLLEEASRNAKQLEAQVNATEAMLASALERLRDRFELLDYIRRSAQASIDDPHQTPALWAQPLVDKINALLGEPNGSTPAS